MSLPFAAVQILQQQDSQQQGQLQLLYVRLMQQQGRWQVTHLLGWPCSRTHC